MVSTENVIQLGKGRSSQDVPHVRQERSDTVNLWEEFTMAKRFFSTFALVLFSALISVSCTTYQSQEVPFRLPAAYGNMQMVDGAQVAAEAYNEEQAEKAFGFNIRKTGILPVQVVVDNRSSQALRIVPDQTFLVDEQGNLWNLLDNRTAYERVETSTEYGRIAKGAGRGGMFGAAGGALVGAALGVLTGENVGSAAAKGAAVGGAGGAVIGGAQSGTSDEAGREIARDLGNKELRNKAIAPNNLGRGFLFFPGEASDATQLRLQIEEVSTGQVHTRTFNMK